MPHSLALRCHPRRARTFGRVCVGVWGRSALIVGLMVLMALMPFLHAHRGVSHLAGWHFDGLDAALHAAGEHHAGGVNGPLIVASAEAEAVADAGSAAQNALQAMWSLQEPESTAVGIADALPQDDDGLTLDLASWTGASGVVPPWCWLGLALLACLLDGRAQVMACGWLRRRARRPTAYRWGAPPPALAPPPPGLTRSLSNRSFFDSPRLA